MLRVSVRHRVMMKMVSHTLGTQVRRSTYAVVVGLRISIKGDQRDGRGFFGESISANHHVYEC